MQKEQILHYVKTHLTTARYQHVVGVAAAAKQLAIQYGGDPEQAEIAGLLHDVAKQLPLEKMQSLAQRSFGDTLDTEIMVNGNLLHGYAAVTMARELFGVTDATLLASLAHHTTGAPVMNTLEKIVFLADYIEVHRTFPGVETLRALAKQDLDRAVLAGYDSTLYHLLEEKQPIYVGTVVNRNALLAMIMKNKEGKGYETR